MAPPPVRPPLPFVIARPLKTTFFPAISKPRLPPALTSVGLAPTGEAAPTIFVPAPPTEIGPLVSEYTPAGSVTVVPGKELARATAKRSVGHVIVVGATVQEPVPSPNPVTRTGVGGTAADAVPDVADTAVVAASTPTMTNAPNFDEARRERSPRRCHSAFMFAPLYQTRRAAQPVQPCLTFVAPRSAPRHGPARRFTFL